MCSAGPRDRPFEEQHSATSIAVVLGGTFDYRTPAGREFMTPGSLLLGNAGDCFRCGHEHGTGDRCISFSYTPEFFEGLATDGAASRTRFTIARIPPLRSLSPVVAKVGMLRCTDNRGEPEALAIRLAVEVTSIGTASSLRNAEAEPGSVARVTRVVRMIESEPDASYDLNALAQAAHLSAYHFLRIFVAVTGVTPHQYLLRTRLRRAAIALKSARKTILDIGLGCGFNDISNFNRAFRAEFGVSPRAYRRTG